MASLKRCNRRRFALEFASQGIVYARKVELPVPYRGQRLNIGYRADFLCFGDAVVELKALDRLMTREEAQVISYLHLYPIE